MIPKNRALLLVALLALAAALLVSLLPEPPPPDPLKAPQSPEAPAALPVAAYQPSPEFPPVVARLNLGKTPLDDLKALDQLLFLLRSNVKDLAKQPLGTNREFTAALTGKNPARLAVLPADHPAISPSGELLDRFGTPYVFHPVSSNVIELRSAGPDRRPYTSDDLLLSPTPLKARPAP